MTPRRAPAVATAAGVAVLLLGGTAALALRGDGTEQPTPTPAGQLVEPAPSTTAPTTTTTGRPVVAEPVAPPAIAPAQQATVDNGPMTTSENTPPAEPVPTTTNAVGEVTSPPPAPTVRCRMDDSDPVNYPNGREVCETVTSVP